MIQHFTRALCDLIYPTHCMICKRHLPVDKNNHSLCLFCQSKIKENRQAVKRPRKSSHIRNVHGVLIYNDEMKRLIHLFKYGNRLRLRRFFGSKLAAFIRKSNIDASKYDLIVPIPLHSVRLRERGFNQSRILAESLSQEYRIPLSANNLIRTKNTQNQAVLSSKNRWTNIQGAFRIKAPLKFHKKNILLVDDLITTGATASEAAKLLKAAQAENVDILALATAQE